MRCLAARWTSVLGALVAVLSVAGPSPAATIEHVTQISVPNSVPVLGGDPAMRPSGFNEREYLVSGSANTYTAGPDGQAQISARDVPYATRMLVRRPESEEDGAGGTVVLELLDATTGWDADQIWRYSREHLLREGITWVGLSVDPAALEALRATRPERYGGVSMPTSGLAWDIVSQIAGTLRDRRSRENPLRFDRPKRLIVVGYGRSAEYLITYQNVFHWTTARRDGSPAIDGYLIAGAGGVARSVSSPATDAVTGDGRLVVEHEVPVIRVQSETDLTELDALTARQSDNAHFRLWEVAGASHIDAAQRVRLDAVFGRDIPGYVPIVCTAPTGDIPLRYALNAALGNLGRWNGRGLGPVAARIRTTAGASPRIVRDGDGNAIGGVRLPLIDVPTGRNAPRGEGLGDCRLAGTYTEFRRSELRSRYPDRADYVKKLRAAAAEAFQNRVMLRADLHEMVRESRG
jgi:hypothetical protein